MDMRLLGTPTIADIGPDLVDTRNISAHIVAVPTDRQYDANCARDPAYLMSKLC